MKRNEDFIFRKVAGKYLLAPVGEAAESFSGMLTLNETGKFIWELLEEEQDAEELSRALAEECDAPLDLVREDVEAFLQSLRNVGAILED